MNINPIVALILGKYSVRSLRRIFFCLKFCSNLGTVLKVFRRKSLINEIPVMGTPLLIMG